MIQILTEIWEKQHNTNTNNLLPITLTGPWEMIVAGSWKFTYPDRINNNNNHRNKKKNKATTTTNMYCDMPKIPKVRVYDHVSFDDDWIPNWTADDSKDDNNNDDDDNEENNNDERQEQQQ